MFVFAEVEFFVNIACHLFHAVFLHVKKNCNHSLAKFLFFQNALVTHLSLSSSTCRAFPPSHKASSSRCGED